MANPLFVRILVVLLASAAVGPVAQAKDYAVTLYGAYRDGGSFTDASTGQSLDIQGSDAAAVSLDLPLDVRRQLQLFVSRQSSHLRLGQAAAPSTAGSELPLTVTYLHIGGTYFLGGRIGQGPYMVGGLGVTLFDLRASGFETEVRPSLNLGIGYQLPLGEHVALRFEGRGYATLVDSSGGLFCSGGCVISIKGSTVTQGEALLGLSFRF
jgi:hypothetical protein